MKSNYKPLGDFIEEINIKNKDLKEDNLLGVSISKKFIPSIANTHGTNFKNYKVIKYNQFAYGPVTSRNGDKISIALLKEKSGIISSSYKVFKIIDEKILCPDYLMLWFEREEFDRYARFKSHGSVREIFSWEELSNTLIPVPDIEIQQKIVKIDKVIRNRIRIKEELNNNLISQAKSLFNEFILNKQENLPDGWEVISLGEIAYIQNGFAFKSKDYVENGIPMIRTKDINSEGFINNSELISLPLSFYNEVKYEDFKFKCFDTVLVMVGASIGKIGIITDINLPSLQNQNMWRFRTKSNLISPAFVYFYVEKINEIVYSWATGSARSFYRKNMFSDAECILPSEEYLITFNNLVMPMLEKINKNVTEIEYLTTMRGILLPKLMSGEIDSRR